MRSQGWWVVVAPVAWFALAAPVLAQAGDAAGVRPPQPPQPPAAVEGGGPRFVPPVVGPGFRPERRDQVERFQMDRIARAIEQGRPLDPQMEQWLAAYSESHLIRPSDLNPVDDAHYSVAEIYLRKEQYADCLQRLRKVIESAGEENETAWVTHLNMGNVERRRGAIQQAIEEYKRVKGRWAGYAQRRLLATMEESGLLDEAVAVLEANYARATDRGEQLAILKRIADIYARNGEDEKAIATYDRIASEFGRDEMDRLVQAANEYVVQRMDRAMEFLRAGQEDEIEPIEQEIQQRIAALRAQGRDAEADAMQRAQEAARRRLEQEYRKRRRPGPGAEPPVGP